MCCVWIVSDMLYILFFFFLMIRRQPRSTQSRSSAASDVYKRQVATLIDLNNTAAIPLYFDVFTGSKIVPNLTAAACFRTDDLSNIGTNYVTGACLLYTSPSPRDRTRSRMPSSA